MNSKGRPNSMSASAGPGRGVRACAVAAVGLGLGGLGSPALGQYNPGLAPPIVGMELKQNLDATIDLKRTLRDHTGREVALGTYFNQDGRPVWLALVYFRCPMACPMIMNTMRSVVSSLRDESGWRVGEKYNVVIVTFDPSEQQEAVAGKRKEFMPSVVGPGEDGAGLETSFGVLYGDAGEVRALADELGFPYRYLPESGEFSHATVTMVLSPGGKITRYLEGSVVPTGTVKLALLEASEGKVGSIIERFMSFCFHWNPITGSYTLSAWRLMQIGATASAVVVGGLVLRGVVIERRRRRARVAAAEGGAGGGAVGAFAVVGGSRV